jgi:YVTN family beta-propeller protein
VGSQPNALAITPDGTQAYVTNFASRSVSVIDSQGRVVKTTVTATGRTRSGRTRTRS